MNVLIIALGIFLQVFGAWGIDFAHGAWERWVPRVYHAGYNQQEMPPMETVGLPWFGGHVQVTAAFWWNVNFFFALIPGSFLVISGAML